MAPSPALAGLQVVELGNMVSASYAARLMADLGADVIKVETPDGDEARRRGPYPLGRSGDGNSSGLYLYLNANKRGITLDLADPRDREILDALLAGTDVLIHNLSLAQAEAAGIDAGVISRRNPTLVHTWVTPFGLSGPRANWQGTNLTVAAAGGWASVTPGNSQLDQEPPLIAFGQQADFQAALHCAVATMGALLARRRTGAGQLVEVSAQECIAAALELALVTYTYTGQVASRLGIRTSAPMEIMECSDGLIFVMTTDPHQWDAFVRVMDEPEWASWEIFNDRFLRGQNRDALKPLIEDWLRQRTVQEVFDLAGQARIPFAPVSNIADLVNSPHLKSRGFFVELNIPGNGAATAPGAPYVMPDGGWEIRRPAPRLGEHNGEILQSLKLKARA